jgi:hypothetical protein
MTAIRVSVGNFSPTLFDDQLDRAVHGEQCAAAPCGSPTPRA